MIPKSFYYKIALIIVVLIGINYLYKYTYYEKDIQTYSDVINDVRKVVRDSCEVVYVGESSNTNYREDDIDKRSISAFISDYYPSIKFGDITKMASHAGIYYVLLKNIPEQSAIKTVIVTLNLRSFDANWIYSNLETPLQKSIVLLKGYPPLLGRFLLAFKGYDIKNEEERVKQPIIMIDTIWGPRPMRTSVLPSNMLKPVPKGVPSGFMLDDFGDLTAVPKVELSESLPTEKILEKPNEITTEEFDEWFSSEG